MWHSVLDCTAAVILTSQTPTLALPQRPSLRAVHDCDCAAAASSPTNDVQAQPRLPPTPPAGFLLHVSLCLESVCLLVPACVFLRDPAGPDSGGGTTFVAPRYLHTHKKHCRRRHVHDACSVFVGLLSSGACLKCV